MEVRDREEHSTIFTRILLFDKVWHSHKQFLKKDINVPITMIFLEMEVSLEIEEKVHRKLALKLSM